MPLEDNVTGIQDLNPSWPTGVDPVSEGDNHVRLCKSGIQQSFPGMTAAWTTTQKINCVALDAGGGVISSLGVPLDDTDAARKGDVDALNTLIDDNAAAIATNAANIATNATNISNNATNIATNANDIADINLRLPSQYSGGSVSNAGSILSNSTGDFTVSKEGTGIYRLDFTESASTAFAQTLTVGVESAVAIQRYAVVDIRDANTIAVIIVNGANGNAADNQFNFMRWIHA